MLNFITTITNGNDNLYNKIIADYFGIGHGVDIHHWISSIARSLLVNSDGYHVISENINRLMSE